MLFRSNSITGTFTQGAPLPLNLVKATQQTAWAIPEPPPPPKPMPTNVKPAFEVATIKPSRPETPGNSIIVGRGGSNLLTTTNTPLNQLIIMAYGLHPRQLTGLPSWAEDDKYDISAKPNSDGVPNVEQLKEMIRDLLADRFGLKMHKEKRELAVYAITVGKNGPKLAKAAGQGNLPG